MLLFNVALIGFGTIGFATEAWPVLTEGLASGVFVALFALSGLWSALGFGLAGRPLPKGSCLQCGYRVKNLKTCPECGQRDPLRPIDGE